MAAESNPLRVELREIPIKANGSGMYFWDRDLMKWMGIGIEDSPIPELSETVADAVGPEVANKHFVPSTNSKGEFVGYKLDGIGSLLSISELFTKHGTDNENIQTIIKQAVLLSLAAGLAHKKRQTAYSIEEQITGEIRIKRLTTNFVSRIGTILSHVLTTDELASSIRGSQARIMREGRLELFGKKTAKKIEPSFNDTAGQESYVDDLSILGMAAMGLQMAATTRVAISHETARREKNTDLDLTPERSWLNGHKLPKSYGLRIEHAHVNSGTIIRSRLLALEEAVDLQRLKPD